MDKLIFNKKSKNFTFDVGTTVIFLKLYIDMTVATVNSSTVSEESDTGNNK